MADIQEVSAAVRRTNITLVTTTEAVVVTAPTISVPRQAVLAFVFGWALVTTGADTTSLQPRIRRGSSISGTIISDVNIQQIKGAVGTNESVFLMASEELANQSEAQYVYTMGQIDATANGLSLEAAILVLLI